MRELLILLACAVWLQGCCLGPRKEPPVPNDAVGWKDYKEGTTKFRGRFLLRKGQSTDNGKVEVKVVELIPPDCRREEGGLERLAKVRLQFRRISDNEPLCSDVFPESGGGTLHTKCPGIEAEFGVFGVGVRAINLKDGWVYFILTGDC